MGKYVFLLFIFPFAAFSQSALITPIYLIHSKDTIKSIAYPIVNCKAETDIALRINNSIKASVFINDTTQFVMSLLNNIHKKDKSFKMEYKVNHNKNGLLSITVQSIPSKGDRKPPVYLNFDLKTGNIITLNTMFKTKNDSFSFAQAVIPSIIDSVQLLEQTIDKNNPDYGKIIEWLNMSLSNFQDSYSGKYIMTDREIIVYFDCFIPHNLLSYKHSYQVSFYYKTLKNVFKPDMVKRLSN